MYMSGIIGCTVYGLYSLWRYALSEQDHIPVNETPERDPSLGSTSRNNSDRNSGGENNDPLCQPVQTRNRYYDYYPNSPASTSTTKGHSDVPLQSESRSKSMEEKEKFFERLERLKDSRKPKPSVPKPASASSRPDQYPTKPPPSSSDQPQSSAKPAHSPLHSNPTNQPSVPKPASASSRPVQYQTKPPPSSSDQPQSSAKPAHSPLHSNPTNQPSVPKPASASSRPVQYPTKPPPSSSDQPQSSAKPAHSPLHSNPTNQQTKGNYTVFQKDTSSIYKIPKDIESMIEKDIVPDVLKKLLSPSTYNDYFAALLYAEDFYIEKWSDFQLLDVALEIQDAAIHEKSLKNENLKKRNKKDDKTFVVFKIDLIPERQPFLLSRDFVHARRSGSKAKEFKGILCKVVKRNKVLVEFEENFYSQHHPKNRYDISFSFNRVCLKRAHEAIAATSNPLFQNCLFPDSAFQMNIPSPASRLYSNHILDSDSKSAVRQILSSQVQPPYLVEGPLCVTSDELSKSGLFVRKEVLKTYKRSSKCRILVCSPINRTGDILMRSLKKEIPELEMFRANAAFRDVDGVPDDILPLCLYEGGECFSLPSLQGLKQFKVIFSTFVSSFRLHNEGIPAGHFSHIFLVDASSATEPETMIALTNFANENTTVIVTGAPSDRTNWVRSDIARKYGLRISYFERLRATKTYSSSDPNFITAL